MKTGSAQQHERAARARALLRKLASLFPDAGIALRYSSPWELTVAVQLSAQCTDKKVNEVTEKLFKKYPSLESYLEADPRQFERDIYQTGFFRNKARNILAAARQIHDEYGGAVPDSMENLLRLPGVARKTANVILANAFGKAEGIAVDTHVRRFAIKFDLTDHDDPVRIERDLMGIIPRTQWISATYRIIEYGRQICPARKHPCESHPLSILYPPAAKRWPAAR
jgi:endonuclease-3